MRHLVYQHDWISMWEHDDGTPFLVMSPSDGLGTMIVPVTESGEILLQTEFSVAYNERIWFLPSGGVEAGEDPVETANRELQEEAGYKAGRMDFLGELYPFEKYVRVRLRIYLGRDLQPSKLQGDEGYEITVQTIGFDDIEALITAGKLRDSSVIAALYMARTFLQKEQSGHAPQD